MHWQMLIVFLIIATAGLYLSRQTWREWSGKKGCKSGCACGPAKSTEPTLIPVEQLRIRPRGE